MKALLIGTGGVGEALARILGERDPSGQWLEKLVLADFKASRAEEVAASLDAPQRFPAEFVDAGDREMIEALAQRHAVDVIVNATASEFVKPIFDAAYQAGVNYLDLGTYSRYDPDDPVHGEPEEWMAQYQFERSAAWEEKGLLAVTGCGIDPGTVDVFATYAAKHLFDELDELKVRDGNDFEVDGLDLVFGFSVVTVIEECLNPSVFWDRRRGWYLAEPMAEPEIFELPEGIGPVEMVAVEHEEVMYMPRYLDKGLRKVSFKIQLDEDMKAALKYLRALGLDSDEDIRIGEEEVAPIEVVAATAPDPARIGERITGRACVGVNVLGRKDGKDRDVFVYQLTDNQETMQRFGTQAVVTQTAFGPAITLELLAHGQWHGSGVHAPEAFEPEPYLALIDAYDHPFFMEERASAYKKDLDSRALRVGLTPP